MSEPTKPERIPFAVEISRMIELLAAQIYPSPFALLRENVQNAFDAVLLRKHLGQEFEPEIRVVIQPNRIEVVDNGIGMSRSDLRTHFWRAGSSSKNTSSARAAGVVGTFGIGAMANFGIAEELVVVSESALNQERTRCLAKRSTLSVTEECIDFLGEKATGMPGTHITAIMQGDKQINVKQARTYLLEFVAYLPLRVSINDEVVSGRNFSDAVPPLAETWSFNDRAADLGAGISADVTITGAATGDVRVDLSSLRDGNQELGGRIILRQNGGPLRTYRSQFGLAAVGVSSTYSFGGVADLLQLQPTAGREALTTESMQLLQRVISAVDDFVSPRLAERPESNSNAYFVGWIRQRGRYDLCGHLQVRVEPDTSLSLADVRVKSQTTPILLYAGAAQSIIKHASSERPLVVLSRQSPRRDCELSFLKKYCKIQEITDEPKLLKERTASSYSLAESGLAFRLSSILANDYFLNADVRFGKISHDLPLLVVSRGSPILIYLDYEAAPTRVLVDVYDHEYGAFDHMAKDFVRSQIFPRVADLVPSATKQGAQAFLKAIQRNREVFEYETSDQESLASLWQDYIEGKISMPEAARRSVALVGRSFQELTSAATASVSDIVPDVIANEAALPSQEETVRAAAPPILRPEIETDCKILTIASEEPALKGYRLFLAITDRIREKQGDFFLQPHRTSVIWAGQKALFIFEHHSGDFGLYYDIQASSPIGDQTGGGSFETCTIVMKNRIFIPIPPPIEATFIPQQGEKKRLEIRSDILYIEKRSEQSPSAA